MRLGITLPQFRLEAEPAIGIARGAEEAGIDGVFVFDHLWPLGRPDRPALHGPSLLATLAVETDRVALGTLVARVGLVPPPILLATLVGLATVAEGRFIAGLGTGDRANRPENEAYGVEFASVENRLALLVECCRRLRAEGVTNWVGGHSAAVRRVAAEEADGWNGWGLDAQTSAEEAASVRVMAEHAGRARPPEVTWGGQVLIARTVPELEAKRARYGERPGAVVGTVDDLRRHLAELRAAGATWAICAPLDIGDDPSAVETLAMAASLRR